MKLLKYVFQDSENNKLIATIYLLTTECLTFLFLYVRFYLVFTTSLLGRCLYRVQGSGGGVCAASDLSSGQEELRFRGGEDSISHNEGERRQGGI